ncbi:MAG: hypothetical protein ACJ70T_06250, partial [Nitrososphaera sp.]
GSHTSFSDRLIKTTTPLTPATTTTTTVREGGNEEREDPVVFERKLDIATAGLHSYIREHLLTKISRENAAIIIGYILSMNSEIHLSIITDKLPS